MDRAFETGEHAAINLKRNAKQKINYWNAALKRNFSKAQEELPHFCLQKNFNDVSNDNIRQEIKSVKNQ